ncbi:twin-arginine translocation signal domain-containing protein [Xanthobacter sp. KR7-65]|uniref:twin-arginine translocation signal domain-containing protein n=1 Tax=Xanthobacter sp. KR7-65 TaxID=3156612 RepID=UPI0032B451C5
MPKPTAAANAAPMPASSRRAFLKAGAALGTVAALAVPVAVLPKAEASQPDPVLAALAAVRSARQDRARLYRKADAEHMAGGISAGTDDEVMAACSAYMAALRHAVRTVPTTADGMRAWLALMWAPGTWEGAIPEEEVRPILATVRAYHAREAAHA